MMELKPPEDLRPWGYAPGFYTSRCIDCPKDVDPSHKMADKRAYRCEEHAIEAWRKSMSDTQPEPAGSELVASYADWQQRRGMLFDKVDWAILEYDEFMRDDAYDAQRVLDRIVEGLRDCRDVLERNPTDTRAEVEREVVAWLREHAPQLGHDALADAIERGEYRHDRA